MAKKNRIKKTYKKELTYEGKKRELLDKWFPTAKSFPAPYKRSSYDRLQDICESLGHGVIRVFEYAHGNKKFVFLVCKKLKLFAENKHGYMDVYFPHSLTNSSRRRAAVMLLCEEPKLAITLWLRRKGSWSDIQKIAVLYRGWKRTYNRLMWYDECSSRGIISKIDSFKLAHGAEPSYYNSALEWCVKRGYVENRVNN